MSERRTLGETTYESVHGMAPGAVAHVLDDVELTFGYGEIWSRPALSMRDRRLVAIVCTTADALADETARFVRASLLAGDLTADELQELMLAIAVYTGFAPVATVMRQAVAAGAAELGVSLSAPLTLGDPKDRHALAVEIWEDVHGVPQRPLDDLLMSAALEFVCGEVWSRPGLSRRDRRLAALCIIAGQQMTHAIETHVRTAVGSGAFTIDELAELATHLALFIGLPRAQRVMTIVERVRAELVHVEGPTA